MTRVLLLDTANRLRRDRRPPMETRMPLRLFVRPTDGPRCPPALARPRRRSLLTAALMLQSSAFANETATA